MNEEKKPEGKQNFKDLEGLVNEAREKSKQAPAKPLSASLDVKENKPKKLPNIRTYQYDAHSAIEKSDASLARMKLAEEKVKKTKPKKNLNVLWFLIVIILLLGLGAVSYLYILPIINTNSNSTPILTDARPEALLAYDEYINAGTTPDSIKESIPGTADGIIFINITSTSSPKQIVPRIFSNIPNRLSRNLENQYMIGFDGNNNSGFAILKSSYNFSLAEMRNWEKNLVEDYFRIFGNISTSDNFVDKSSPNSSIIRGNNSLNYAVRRDGYIIIAENIETILDIINLIQ